MNLDSCVFHLELGEIPRLEKMKIAEGEWRDGILVRSPNWLGDAVMAIPAILQLKTCLPPFCGLFVACPKGIAPVFEAIAGGAAYGAAKRWPAESFRELGRRWMEEEGGVVVTIGSKGERGITAEILNGLPPERCWNAAGETSMDELIYLLKHAEMCVANDSGVMHLAAALGVPGVAPFGCTDPAATSPLSARWTIAFHKIECAPCFKRVCPLGTKKCFDAITPEVVWKIMKSN